MSIISYKNINLRHKKSVKPCTMLAPHLEALDCLSSKERATQKPHACMYNISSTPIVAIGVWVHQWLHGI